MVKRVGEAKLAIAIEEVESDNGGNGHGYGHCPDTSLYDTWRITVECW